jgi:hypothetical protein
MRISPSALGAVVAAVVAAGCGTAGDRPPAGAPADAAAPPPADAATPEAPPAAAAPDNASATAPLTTPAPMPAEVRRAQPPERRPMPAEVRRAQPPRPPDPPPPPPPVVEIQWTIDETIPTPDDIRPGAVLAKFRAPDGAVIVVYRSGERVVRRRIRGFGGGFSHLVEELDIDDRPPGWKS